MRPAPEDNVVTPDAPRDSGVRPSRDADRLPIGCSLGQGRYRIVDVIDQGSTCTVYLARQVPLDRLVAIKVLSPEYMRLPFAHGWVDAEAMNTAAFDHPNIVRILDRGEHGGLPYLVFELLRGENLDELITRRGPLPVDEASALVSDILAALAVAHDAHIVHRDVKPQNVVVVEGHDDAGMPRLRAKLCDLGLASHFTDNSAGSKRPDACLCGTPEYMAPEQAEGLAADSRSDLYSVGITLFHMLTGQVPFRAAYPMATAAMHVTTPLPSARSLVPSIPDAIEAFLQRATAKAPGDRFANARDMRRALLAIAGPDHPHGDTASVVVSPSAFQVEQSSPPALHCDAGDRSADATAPTLRTVSPRTRSARALAACALLALAGSLAAAAGLRSPSDALDRAGVAACGEGPVPCGVAAGLTATGAALERAFALAVGEAPRTDGARP